MTPGTQPTLTHPGPVDGVEHSQLRDGRQPDRGSAEGAITTLRRVLREHELRCTSQRLAVVALLAGSQETSHLTAAEIHSRLAEAGHDLDASTVYRTLSTLVDIGILHTTTQPDLARAYGMATTAHHHAICTHCGRLREIPAPPLRAALHQAARISHYQLTDDSLMLQGICPDCQHPPHQ